MERGRGGEGRGEGHQPMLPMDPPLLFFYFILFLFYLFLINRTITIFLNKFQYEKKCSDEEAQEKPQGLCELSFLKI